MTGSPPSASVASPGRPRSVPAQTGVRPLTPWLLFTIFVFGPCEVLIPLLLAPAAAGSARAIAAVAAVFGAATIGTMVAAVLLLRAGFGLARSEWLERHLHPLAGGTIAACGALMLLGL